MFFGQICKQTFCKCQNCKNTEKITLLYLTYAHISIICCHYLERLVVASGIDINSLYGCLMTAVFYSSLCYTKVIEVLGKSSSWVNNSIWSSITDNMKRKAQNEMAPVINISNNKVHHCMAVAKLQLLFEKQIFLHRVLGWFLSTFSWPQSDTTTLDSSLCLQLQKMT